MRRIIALDGVSIPDASDRQAYTLTPADRAMAHIPGWCLYVDPDHIVSGNARNVAMPRTMTGNNGTPNARTTMPDSDAPAFDVTGARHIRPNLDFPLEAWSVFAVAHLTGASSRQWLVGAIADPAAGGLRPSLGFSLGSGHAAVWSEENVARVTCASRPPHANFTGRTILFMFTFSIREGLRIFVDGIQAASNPTDTAVFTSGYGAGEWRFLHGCRGLFGNIGLLSIDLGWEEHADFRREIEDFHRKKYTI